ncbi:MAG: hypothetical protein JST86_05865 [Bacteroidetes bacterium]|nr:hypothetical protein [Bacteroidota bacterium]
MSTNTSLPEQSHFITLTQAVDMTTLYRTNREAILKTAFQGQNILALSETFNRNAFDTLLAEPGCAGLRIYYGMNTDLTVHAIVVAVNSSNEDILPASTSRTTIAATDIVIVEESQRCPEHCPADSVLNTP